MKQALRRMLRSSALVGALLAGACAALCLLHRSGDEIRFLERLERATLDLRFQARGELPHRGHALAQQQPPLQALLIGGVVDQQHPPQRSPLRGRGARRGPAGRAGPGASASARHGRAAG